MLRIWVIGHFCIKPQKKQTHVDALKDYSSIQWAIQAWRGKVDVKLQLLDRSRDSTIKKGTDNIYSYGNHAFTNNII